MIWLKSKKRKNYSQANKQNLVGLNSIFPLQHDLNLKAGVSRICYIPSDDAKAEK